MIWSRSYTSRTKQCSGRTVAARWVARLRRSGALLIVASATSCSSESSPSPENARPVYPVAGKVLVQNKPAVGAFVLLVPVNEPADAQDPRPRATVSDDGTFELSTYGENDGAPAGEYLVSVTWPGGVRSDGSEEPEDKLLGRYRDAKNSKLRATVSEGTNELPAFNLK